MLPDAQKDASKMRYFSELVYFLRVIVDKCDYGKEEDPSFRCLSTGEYNRKADRFA